MGQIFSDKSVKMIAVVSNDEGYQALRDYWETFGEGKRRVILGENIERCIITASISDERSKELHSQIKRVDITTYYREYMARGQSRETLKRVFHDTKHLARLKEIDESLQTGGDAKGIYAKLVHFFGREDGKEVYETLKNAQLVKVKSNEPTTDK